MECRKKTVHQLGNVGKVQWEDLGGHDYTGIFNGGSDTGFARLSSQFVTLPDSLAGETGGHMNPSIAIKFLRDGIDSGNIMGNVGVYGQRSFNFFKHPCDSILTDNSGFENPPDLTESARTIKPETGFVDSIGHLDFAQFNNDGSKVEEPVLPFRVRYVPDGNISFPDEYTEDLLEQLMTIE